MNIFKFVLIRNYLFIKITIYLTREGHLANATLNKWYIKYSKLKRDERKTQVMG